MSGVERDERHERLERPAFYALAPGRLARPRHAAPPAVHGLAPELRRARRRGRAARSRAPPAGRARRLLPRRRRQRSRARRAARPAAADAPVATDAHRARRARPGRRGGDRDRGVVDRVRLADPASWPPGAFIVVAYNLELFGGRFHSDIWFGARLGGVPRVHGLLGQALRSVSRAGRSAAAASRSALAQRRLSTPARELRRRTISCRRAAPGGRRDDRAERRSPRGPARRRPARAVDGAGAGRVRRRGGSPLASITLDGLAWAPAGPRAVLARLSDAHVIHDNVEVVTRLLAAFSSRDAEGMVALLDPEVVFEPAPTTARPHRTYVGHAGMRELPQGHRPRPGSGSS